MNNFPLVSIIINTKNASRTLEACLNSVKKQTYPNIELIIVDHENTTDNTREIAKKYTDKVLVFGLERSPQKNYGVKNCSGEYLLIHDSDIYFNENTVQECVDIVLKTDCDAIIIPEKSVGSGFWTKVKAFERSFYVGNSDIEGIRFFKKESYDKVGGFDEELYAGEDWDITIRFRKAGFKIERAKIFVDHDEGKLTFFGSSKKKKYYAPNLFNIYAKKHPEEFRRQMNFFTRFPIEELITNFIKHPILTLCMILMKGAEFLNSVR